MADDYVVGMDELEEWVGDGAFRKYTIQSNTTFAQSKGINLPEEMKKLKAGKELFIAKAGTVDQTAIDIDLTLSATGSNRFYSGDEAQKGVQNLQKIRTTFSDLVNSLRGIDDNEVGKAIAKYNADLKIVKKESRLKALQEYVDTINGTVVKEWNKTETYENGNGSPTSGEWREGNFRISATYSVGPTDDKNGTITQKYYIHYKKSIDIDYDGWIKSDADTTSFLNIKSWFDDGYDKLAGKINKVASDGDVISKGLSIKTIDTGKGDPIDDEIPDSWCTWNGY